MSEQGEAHNALEGRNIWLVSDGTADAGGWERALIDGLRAAGARDVDAFGLSQAMGVTAKNLLQHTAGEVSRLVQSLFGSAGAGDAAPKGAAAPRRFRPDLVIVDSPAVLRPLDLLHEATRSSALVVGLVSGFHDAADWRGARAHAWVVPVGTMMHQVAPEASPIAFEVAGPPLPGGFARPLDRAQLREESGFGAGDLVTLFDASTMTDAQLDLVMVQLRAVPPSVVPVFFYGNRSECADVLRQLAHTYGVRARIFGAVPDPEAYLLPADLVVAGKGSQLVGPALALGRALVALEAAAAPQVLLDAGAMRVLRHGGDLAARLAELAGDGIPEDFVQPLTGIHPGGTAEVVAALGRLLDRRADIFERAATTPPRAAKPTADVGPGRFETIGVGGAAPGAPVSKGQAREQLTALIMEERRLEHRLGEAIRDRDRWMERAGLAADEGEEELAAAASAKVEEASALVRTLNREVETLQSRKSALRRRVAGVQESGGGAESGKDSASGAMEERFRTLEVERQMRKLREKSGAAGAGDGPAADGPDGDDPRER